MINDLRFRAKRADSDEVIIGNGIFIDKPYRGRERSMWLIRDEPIFSSKKWCKVDPETLVIFHEDYRR